MFFEI